MPEKKSTRTRSKKVVDRDFSTLTTSQKVADVPHLYVWCTPKPKGGFTRSYRYRATCAGKLFQTTFGKIETVTFAEAVAEAEILDHKIAAGIDLIAEQAKEKHKKWLAKHPEARAKPKKKPTGITFERMTAIYIDYLRDDGVWKHPEQMAQDKTALIANHLTRELLMTDIAYVTPEAVADALRPSWTKYLIQGVRVLHFVTSAAQHLVDYDHVKSKVPFITNKAVEKFLPSRNQMLKHRHHPYLPVEEMPDFLYDLLTTPQMAARCLAFQIFCALRSTNARLARWSQIDFEKKLYVCPRNSMKEQFENDVPHYVPLSESVLRLLAAQPRFFELDGTPVDWVFPSSAVDDEGRRRPLAEKAMNLYLSDLHKRRLLEKKMMTDAEAGKKIPARWVKSLATRHKNFGKAWTDPTSVNKRGEPSMAVPHGLARTDFESWALDSIDFDHPVYSAMAIDFIMDHNVDQYGGAYKRRPPVGAMREVLEAWGRFLVTTFQAEGPGKLMMAGLEELEEIKR